MDILNISFSKILFGIFKLIGQSVPKQRLGCYICYLPTRGLKNAFLKHGFICAFALFITL